MKNNPVHLIGALTRDIELSKNSKENSFVRFTLACTRDDKPFTDFINCIAFSEVANALCKHRNKDTAYEINGYLRISSYEKDGKKTYSTIVVVESFTLLNAWNTIKTMSSLSLYRKTSY